MKRSFFGPVTLSLYHVMKMQNEDKIKTEKLIFEILRMADFAETHAEDSSVWKELENKAKKIEVAGKDNLSLVAFHDYAAHWQGLRDVYFPEKQKEWNQKVKHVHQLCEDVMIARGIIKPSILHKLLSMLRSPQQ